MISDDGSFKKNNR